MNPDISQQLAELKEHAAKTENAVKRNNIYKGSTYNKLVNLEDKIDQMSAALNCRFNDVLDRAGIKGPAQILDEAISFWDAKLKADVLPSEGRLIMDLQQLFQLKIKKVDDAYIPPGELEMKGEESPGKTKELQDDANRVSLAIQTILHLETESGPILLNDLDVFVGKIPENTWRTRPYWVISIKPCNIAVFLNNQYGNRTFVLGYKNDQELDDLAGMTKEQLKEKAKIDKRMHHFEYDNPEQFKAALREAIQKVEKKLEMIRPYATYKEAKEAVRKMGIKTQAEYRKRYKEDARLPSNPNKKYGQEFSSWLDFLFDKEKKVFATYEEAKDAVRQMKIQTANEYKERYKEDPRLPSSPGQKYGKAFISWLDFLHGKEKHELYATCEEAKAAVRRMQIKTTGDYKKRHKEDPLLPSGPDQKYGEKFISWSVFLGNSEVKRELYPTYEEAQQAVRRLGIMSAKEYKRRHFEDRHLPGHPEAKYADKFISWPDFLRNG